MNCCKKNTNDEPLGNESNHVQGNSVKGKGHMSHIWMMALCCGLPLALLFIIPLFGVSLFSGALLGIVPLLCPIMMVLMIPMMMRGNRCNREQANNSEPRSIEVKK